ncbi:MAG: HAD family hydrolase [Chloroflexi bacterium]|nr:MAG: HAD family hydrolase [Chloroflexota bacterium]
MKNWPRMNSQKSQERSNTDAAPFARFRIVRAVTAPRAVIFDLGGTLVHWSDWETGAGQKWAASYDHLITQSAGRRWPSRDAYVVAMREAEREHWRRVDTEHWSGPPTGLVREGFDRLGVPVSEAELLAAMDGYAKAIAGWSTVDPDGATTVKLLRDRGYRIGLLSNTWWAADWHNADLVMHGLAALIDVIVYTSDLAHSKPHPAVFDEVASRLGVEPQECVMIGDRMVDDVSGALEAGMRAVWRKNESGFPSSIAVPTAEVTRLAELPELLRTWGGQ